MLENLAITLAKSELINRNSDKTLKVGGRMTWRIAFFHLFLPTHSSISDL